MIALKAGVRLVGLSPQMVFAHTVVASVWRDQELTTLLVTSGSDGNHTNAPRPSGHYAGNALDYHTKGIGMPRVGLIVPSVREALGPDFLVLLEDPGQANEHLHVEYLPKRIS